MYSFNPLQRRAVRTAGIIHTAAAVPLVLLVQASQAYPAQPPMSVNNFTMTPMTTLELEKREEGPEVCCEVDNQCVTKQNSDHCTGIGSAVRVNWIIMGLASVAAMGVGMLC